MFKNGKLPGRAGADRAAEMVGAARPYVQRAVSDKELQQTARRAYEAGRRIYQELWGQSPQKAADKIARDKDLQRNLGEAVRSMREVAGQLGRPPQKGGGGKRIMGMLLVGGGIVALLFNPKNGSQVRGWIMGRLGRGGEEEEFTWSPPADNAAAQGTPTASG
jgi:hypothetical protein